MYNSQRQLPLINHSQLEEQKKSWQDLWDRRTGFRHGNPIGRHTPLGHTYSMILEELAKEGIPIKLNSKEFLDFLKNNHRGNIPLEIDLSEPSFEHSYGSSIYNFMIRKGLSFEASYEIMKEICGYEVYSYSPDLSKISIDKKNLAAGKRRRNRLLK